MGFSDAFVTEAARMDLESTDTRLEAAKIRFETRMEEMRQQRLVGQFSVDASARMQEMLSSGYTDENGVSRKGLKTYSGQEMIETGFSPTLEFRTRMQKWMEGEARRRGLNPAAKEEFARRMGGEFNRLSQGLLEWETKTQLGASVQSVDDRNEAEAAMHRATEVMNARAASENRANLALGTAGAVPDPDYDADADQYLVYQGQARAKYALDLKRASGGLIPTDETVRKAREFYNRQAKADVAAIVAEGDFGRARAYVRKGKDLGFTDDEIRRGLMEIDFAEEKAQEKWVDDAYERGATAAANGQLADVRDAQGRVVPGIETSIRQLKSLENSLPVGSRARANAAKHAAELDKAADNTVTETLSNEMISGRTFVMSDGKTLVFGAGTRQAKCYPHAVKRADETRKAGMSDLDEDIRYRELELDYAIELGTASVDEIAKMKRDIFERVKALGKGRLMRPEDVSSFLKRWKSRNDGETAAAGVMFDRAFGLSLQDFLDARGDISAEATDAGHKKAVKSGQQAVFPGTDEDVSLGEYLKMRASFLERLRALPANADRRQETSKLLEEFRCGWYSRQAKADIEALSRTMNDIHLGIEAEYEAERLRAAAEEQRRNMPVVDRRHPANAEPQPDPLEFYRQANPLDPTTKYR